MFIVRCGEIKQEEEHWRLLAYEHGCIRNKLLLFKLKLLQQN
jgi:hypothetical protein